MQRLAEVVEASGARRREDVLRVASWRLVAGGADAGLMLRAAETARWRFDFDLAERLADAPVHLGARFDARLLLAQLQNLQGRGPEAERQLEELASTASTDTERLLVARAQLDNALRGRDTPRYLELAARVEATIEDPAVRDLIAARRVALMIVHDGFGAGDELLDRLVATTTGEALVFSCYAAAYAWARQGRTSDAIATADRGYTAHLELEVQLEWYPWTHRYFRCLALSYAGELEECEREARQQHARMVESGDRAGQAVFAAMLAQHVAARGNVQSAAKCACEALTVFRDMDRPPLVHFSLLRLALALALGGRRKELATVLHDLDAFATPAVYLADDAEVRAWTAVANGDIPLARSLLEAGVDAGLRVDDLVGASTLLHMLARLGNAKSAALRLAEVAASMDGRLAPARALHADGLVRGNPEMLEAACSDFERMGAYLLAAEAAADAAVAWQRAGATRARSSAERRSSELADRCEGASTPALQAIDFRAQLTPAERETAMLASSGRTDRQIADELHLSVRTVENRLHRVYVKLGISRRDELAEALSD